MASRPNATTGRGGLSKVLIHWGMALAALAFTGWWATSTVLNTDRTRQVAHVVLSDPAFRAYVAGVVGPAVAQVVPLAEQLATTGAPPGATPPVQSAATGSQDQSAALSARLSDVMGEPATRTALEDFITAVHGRLIGTTTTPAVLDQATTQRLVAAAVPTLPAAEVAKIPAVTFDIPGQLPLRTLHGALGQRVGWLLAGAVVLVGAGLVLSTDRRSGLKTVGMWLIGISLGHLVFMWLLPVEVVPAVFHGPWPPLVAEVARTWGAGIVSVLAVLSVIGVAILVADRFVGRTAAEPTPEPET